MCDTFAVMADVSAEKAVVLGKNSDRPSFDCQPLAYHERKEFSEQNEIKLAYITIAQVRERFATLGASPYWCWGYETGMNEFGVAIGNEAVYTKDLAENAEAENQGSEIQKGLLGMELVRLGLERGRTAREVLDVMTELIERYGQWGSGIPMQDTVSGSYNSSFIIADNREVYILETAGKIWAVKRVSDGYAAISNELSIRDDMTECSKDLVAYAVQKKWWPAEKAGEIDFAAAYIERKKARQVSHIRVQRMRQLLKQAVDREGTVSLEWMKRILRDHYEDTFLEGPLFNAADPDFLTLCMHDSAAGFTWGNTAASSLCILPEDDMHLPVMWWAAGVPCCSVYIPVFPVAGGIPDCLKRAGTYGKISCVPSEVKEDTYQEGSFWWEMRSLLGAVNGDELGSCYRQRHTIVSTIFNSLEEKWRIEHRVVEKEAVKLKQMGQIDKMADLLYQFTKKCVAESVEAIEKTKKMFV